jgi:hypothetical protein
LTRQSAKHITHIRHFNVKARGINSKNSQVSFGRATTEQQLKLEKRDSAKESPKDMILSGFMG